MTDTEDRLRSALNREADDIRPATDAWARLERAALERDRRRFPRWVARTGLTLGAAAAAVAVFLTAADDGQPTTVITPGGPTSSVAETVTNASAGRPKSIIAANGTGRIVALSSSDGSVQRVLVEGRKADVTSTGLVGLSVHTPSGRIYFDDGPAGDSSGEIWTVAADGSDHRRILAGGNRPAIDPSGDHLAYARLDGKGSVVIRDLRVGSERVIEGRTIDGVLAVITHLAWSPDGHWIYAAYATKGSRRVVELDPDTARSLSDGRSMSPGEDAPENTVWEHPGARMYGAVVVETCCDDLARSDAFGADLLRVNRLVEVTRAGVRRVLARLPDRVVSLDTNGPGRATGSHIVFATIDAGYGKVWTWSPGDERPRLLTSGYVAVAW